jgi:hypothetical protein
MLVSALELSYGQNKYSNAVAPSKTSPASNFTPSQSSPSADDTILREQQLCLLVGNIDRLKAMSLAVRSLEFHVLAGGHEVQFDGIFLLFSEGFDSSRVPGVVLNSVNVVFSYHDNNSSMENIVISLNPALTSVDKVILHPIFLTSHPPTSLSLGSALRSLDT